MTSARDKIDDTTNDQEASKRNYINVEKKFGQLYKSQHCGPEDAHFSMLIRHLDTCGLKRMKTLVPLYKSGINPNFFDEYFSKIEKNDLTNTTECEAIVWREYQARRWSYAIHLLGYHQGATQKTNREVGDMELWRRLNGNARNDNHDILFAWYFDQQRKIGDVIHTPSIGYTQGLSLMHANFANCPVCPKHTLTFGSVHIGVGFVDLGILLDSSYLEPTDKQESNFLLFRGIEANNFSVAKSLVLWDMMCTKGIKASWVVQVWFSSVWSKRGTNAFLAAARRVSGSECINRRDSLKLPNEVCSLVHHWASSKGVGLKKLVIRRGETRQESSDALFFAQAEDRIEMIRYQLTGTFGLAGEDPCSGSIVMFDCPKTSHVTEATSIFETLTLSDVVSSDLYNGNYFQTAERVKESRVKTLMEYAQAGRIKVQLSVHTLLLKSVIQIEEISRLEPLSISWSNILDYMSRDDFHALAKSCGPTAIHSGYSMNWTSKTYGTSLIDYPLTSNSVIKRAEKATASSFRDICGQRRIFLTPIQSNPLNITASFLADRCHSHWVSDFFGEKSIRIIEAGMMDHLSNPLSRVPTVVSSYWTYRK